MDVYGLTGGIGSGKSAAAEIFEDHGIPVVSADELSRVVVTPGSEGLGAVIAAFGPGILDDHGELDRRKLGALVFKDPSQRQRLESILHPRIRERFQDVLTMLKATGHAMVVYEVPLLFETGLDKQVKAVILVSAPEAQRIARVMARDRLTEPEVRARLAAQLDDATRRARSHFVLENDGDLAHLRAQVDALLPKLRAGVIPKLAGPQPAPPAPTPGNRPTTAPGVASGQPSAPSNRPATAPGVASVQPSALAQTPGNRPAVPGAASVQPTPAPAGNRPATVPGIAPRPTAPPSPPPAGASQLGPPPATAPPRIPPPPKTKPK
jgi:dephospho-CoA kinase